MSNAPYLNNNGTLCLSNCSSEPNNFENITNINNYACDPCCNLLFK